ncbi:TetR family transcriptional regulator [Embleya hyalina]|uniref:TetR family transcriptional regulator n=1 Tax=Embleya hyalina TaxID=516124 RepID=A0A401YG32_9ACTN|nr:TetR family transcriptional regulator [Embleya hyalina]
MRAILEAAERVLSANPSATMEQIAEAAGVARTTVHRRFATRDALIVAMTRWATQQFHDAVTAARSDATPPAVALYQVTANVLRVKIAWGFAMNALRTDDPEVAHLHTDVLDRCDRLFRRARESGLLRPEVDLDWTRRVYYALIHESAQDDRGEDADVLATRIVDTLLRGFGASDGPTTR